jgi:16S rRNA (uracil1498-N3)-methyltransferase
MTRRRWIADEVVGNTAALTGPHAEHLAVVLRAQPDQRFDVVAGGVLRAARVTSVTPARVEFELQEELPAPVLPEITLLLGVFKFDRMEWAIEKCVELGVERVVPAITRRTGVHLARAAVTRVERWRRLAMQACEQARRARSAAVDAPVKLERALQTEAATRIVLAETEQVVSLRDALKAHPSGGSLALMIGPEGGWSEDEMSLCAEAGWVPASLGQTILRAETAAIAATAIAFSELG